MIVRSAGEHLWHYVDGQFGLQLRGGTDHHHGVFQYGVGADICALVSLRRKPVDPYYLLGAIQ